MSLLDPAVGSGTFPLAAAQQAIANVAKLLGSGSVRTVLEERVLPNFAGLELMPAPYTIAHVKFALFARDQHVRFKDKRARIYLTNTLGDPLESPALVGHQPQQQPQIERLFAAWKTVDGKPINDARIALNDDYLKFLRWAVWKLLKQDHAAGRGIIAFVTNHAFINGRIHRGVRKALLDAFDDIYVFNVQGNRRNAVKAVPDENVFPPVKQGVAMTVLVRRATTSPPAGRVHYREMRGKRAEKYAAATAARLGDSDWRPITPTAPYYSFAADTDDRFAAWPSVPAVFPTSASGVQSSRDDLVADLTAAPIEDRMRLIADPSQSDAELKEQLGIRENQRWSWAEHRSQFKGYRAERTIPWTYRLFDRRLIYWDPVFVEWPRQRLNRHLLPAPFGPGGEDRLALVVQRTGPKPVGAIASVSRGIACAHVTSQWCHVYPLRLAPE